MRIAADFCNSSSVSRSLTIPLFRDVCPNGRHANFRRDYSFHPLSNCKRGYTGGFASSSSVSPEYLREFNYPFAFS